MTDKFFSGLALTSLALCLTFSGLSFAADPSVTAAQGPTLKSSARDVEVPATARPIASASDLLSLTRVGRYADNLYYSWPEGYPWDGKLAKQTTQALPQIIGVRTAYCQANPQHKQNAVVSPVTKTITFAHERFNCRLNNPAAYVPVQYIVKDLTLVDNSNPELDYYQAQVQAVSYGYQPADKLLLAVYSKSCKLGTMPKGGFVTWYWLEGSRYADIRLMGDTGDCQLAQVWVNSASQDLPYPGFTKLTINFSQERWPKFDRQ